MTRKCKENVVARRNRPSIVPVTEDGTIVGVRSVSNLLRADDELSRLALEGGADEDRTVRA